MKHGLFLALTLASAPMISIDAAQAPAQRPVPKSAPPDAHAPIAPFVDAQRSPIVAPDANAPTTASADAAPTAPIEPWKEKLADGLAEVRRLVEKKEPAEARELCERLVAPNALLRWKEGALADGGWRRSLARVAAPVLEFAGAEPLSAPARAEVRFASGLAAVVGEDALGAENAFASAQALAGPGELRLASGYQLATVALLEAEALREKIPEIQQKQGQGASGAPPSVPQPAPQAGAGVPNEPDPLQLARAAYLRARAKYAERLRADWRDADTRANTELVSKRLKELDELERQRKEQQKKDSKDQDPNQQKDPNEKKDDASKDPQKPKDDQERKPDESKPDEKQDEPKPDEQKPDDAKPDEKKEAQQPKLGEERELSKEELSRLFDLLQQREQQWKKLQQQLQQARRAKVKKDW
ncbi:MAG: hypothetical protein HZA53_07750 [Planctomycetes bacterium]|nr:hypothetical protein [Planctomycetota bacterium]